MNKSIAICAIWAAVAVVGWNSPDAGVIIGLFGMIATIVLVVD